MIARCKIILKALENLSAEGNLLFCWNLSRLTIFCTFLFFWGKFVSLYRRGTCVIYSFVIFSLTGRIKYFDAGLKIGKPNEFKFMKLSLSPCGIYSDGQIFVFLSAAFHVEGVKITPKVRSKKCILLHISKSIECKLKVQTTKLCF